MMLSLDLVRMDGGTQPRSTLDNAMVNDFANAMITGAMFPPITVFYDGESYWLADGFHRTKAAIEARIVEIEAEIIQGTLDDARWHSFGANQQHGLRRTNDDKQRAVQAALQHPKSQGLSDSAIAKHIGVHHDTVREWRSKLEASCGIRKIEERTVTRNGTTYQQNTANIGRREPSEPKASESLPPLPRAIQIPVVDRKAVWACQTRKNFEKELLRLIKAYEKSNAPVEALVVLRNNGVPVGIEISSALSEVNA